MDVWYSKAIKDELPNAGAYVGGPYRIVLHSTEGATYAGAKGAYTSNNNCPHFTASNEGGRFQVWQHVPLDMGSSALKHPEGTVDTNLQSAIQIEAVAMAAQPAWASGLVAGVGELMAWIGQQCSVQATAPTFKAYPASGGVANGVRFTPEQWTPFNGVCGHQHVPNNDHGDPGAIAIATLLSSMGAGGDAGSNPSGFTAAGLVQWAAGRVGVTVPGTVAELKTMCVNAKTTLPVADAAKIPGALLFDAGGVAISLGDGSSTIQSTESLEYGYGVHRGKVDPQFVSAGLIPGMNYPSTGVSPTTRLPNQYKVRVPTEEQQANIKTVVDIGLAKVNADTTLTASGKLQVLVAAVEGIWQESKCINLPGGDGTSVGIFQLISSNGTYEQRHDVTFSANWFYTGAVGSPYKNNKGTAGQLTQSRQQSGFPAEYDKWRNQAVADLYRLNIEASTIDP